jgi:HEAT repeat protein
MTDEPARDLARLIEAALSNLDDEDDDRQGPPTGWRAVQLLRNRADAATLAAAVASCKSDNEKRRRVGAAILGQLGHSRDNPDGVFREERYNALEALLLTEIATTAKPEVLDDACVALGHLQDRRAVPLAMMLIAHANADVRFGVVSALTGHDDEAAIAGLIRLSSDSDPDVRDWATFGLGQQIDTDNDLIRAALHARTADSHPDVRNEAIAGLARRGDRSIVQALARELGTQVAVPLFEAARDLADPSLCSVLSAARKIGQPWPDHETQDWLEAMAACGCATPDV